MLDADGLPRRIEIRHALSSDDDLPPLSSGRLSAARLRTATSLSGWIERMIRHDKTANIPGALVSVMHLKSAPAARRGPGAQ